MHLVFTDNLDFTNPSKYYQNCAINKPDWTILVVKYETLFSDSFTLNNELALHIFRWRDGKIVEGFIIWNTFLESGRNTVSTPVTALPAIPAIDRTSNADVLTTLTTMDRFFDCVKYRVSKSKIFYKLFDKILSIISCRL